MLAAFCAPFAWAAIANSKTVSQAVKTAKLILARSRVPEPAASAEYLALATFHGIKTRSDAVTTTRKPNDAELKKYLSLCRQRAEHHVPVQYLVGDWDFHNLTLRVKAPVLIPRPETEELVELVLADKHISSEGSANILDVGCGTGAIMLALLKARSNWHALGIDISQDAVTLTRENIRNLNLDNRANASLASLQEFDHDPKFNALVSNPPYIPRRDINFLERQVREHEDIQALSGGEDGLDVIKDILQHAPQLVVSGGSVWMEVERTHPNKLQDMKSAGLQFVGQYSDLSGNPRFCQWRVL